MSVLCCLIPQFLYKLASRHQEALQDQPLALLGPDDCIWSMSRQAAASGVKQMMKPRQAQMHCPDIKIQPLNLIESQAEQQAFLHVLSTLELPTEEVDWGTAYLDLHTVATKKQDIQGIAGELGRKLRGGLGIDLEPALGWDSGKFTARAAAVHTLPGRMRLVSAYDEKRFLDPLPITLLPLPPATLQQLQWLGICTLGQFGALPTNAVWERFGRAGKEAQQWARGQDKRPVLHTINTMAPTDFLEFDPPTIQLTPVLAKLDLVLHTHLQKLTDQLQGCSGLHINLTFEEASTRTISVNLAEPTSSIDRLSRVIQQQLTTLNWPGALTHISLTVKVTELPLQQMTLFPETALAAPGLEQLAQSLVRRHGPIFFKSIVDDATHPIPERRTIQAALV